MYLFKTFKKNQISLLKFESSFTKLTQKKIFYRNICKFTL